VLPQPMELVSYFKAKQDLSGLSCAGYRSDCPARGFFDVECDFEWRWAGVATLRVKIGKYCEIVGPSWDCGGSLQGI